MIEFCDVGWQFKQLGPAAARSVQGLLLSGSYILGDEVKAFEAEAASYLGCKYALGVASGTDALVIALKAAGVAERDEVVCPSLTFVATAHAIRRVGAKPVFVDVDPNTLCIDVEAVAAAVTPQTTAVVPVHLYGAVADMGRLKALADRIGVAVVEDAAQAFGAAEKGSYAGTVGDVGCFSFFPAKPLGCCGDGGMLVTDSESIYSRSARLRRQGFAEKNNAGSLGLNSRLDAVQACILRHKLTKLGEWQQLRSRIAADYVAAFGDIETDDVLVARLPHGQRHAWHLYVVEVEDRPRFRKHLREAGVPTLVHYDPAVHQQPYYVPERHSKKMSLSHTERITPLLCSLPLYAGMSTTDVERVIDAVRSYYDD